MGQWSPPHRNFEGTADRTIDIAFLGLPASPAYQLSEVLKADFIVGDNTCYIDWPNSTNLVLEVKADPGIAWQLALTTRDHQGIVEGL